MTEVGPEDPEMARSLVSHTLCLYVRSVKPDRVAAAMSMVIPALMARATGEGEGVYSETSARLLELAAVNQDVFKAIVGGLSGGQRAFLEEVIRSGRPAAGAADKTLSSEASQPTIQLKMNFGG